MTPDLEPLLCSCGKHSARLQPPGCKKPKWQVFSVKKTGNKPQVVTSRAKKEDALCVVRDLCAGVYEKQNQPRAAAAVPEARSRPVRKRKQPDEATAPATAATKPAGPGRGHKGPRWTDPVQRAERVLAQSKPAHGDMRYALERTTEECKRLRKLCEEVRERLVVYELSLCVRASIDCCLHLDR
jgi:hypothetical protein